MVPRVWCARGTTHAPGMQSPTAPTVAISVAAAVGAAAGTAAWAIILSTTQRETALAAVAIAGAVATLILATGAPGVDVDVQKAAVLAAVFCGYQTCLYVAAHAMGPMAQAVVNCNVVFIFAATQPAISARTAVTAAGCAAYFALAVVIAVRTM